ncbi:MAG: AgmX/PglI C-terminal domain-containing protein [Deltaproteobacteria bacterium]|nr:AgmX/PglI C-terminal domain-containing protein [Deltaproteobacteria bacterium]
MRRATKNIEAMPEMTAAAYARNRSATIGLTFVTAFVTMAATLLCSCGSESGKTTHLKASVASVAVLRSPVQIAEDKGKARTVATDRRVSIGATVRTDKAGRALVKLDRGSLVLMDQKSALRLTKDGLELLAGRIYVDAKAEITVATTSGTIRAVQAGFDVSLGKATKVYCAAGELAYLPASKVGKEKPKSLTAGMTLTLNRDKAQILPEAIWDDWTAGMARVGSARAMPPAGIGTMGGRPANAYGSAPNPLLVRRHDVKIRIVSDMAITQVTQTFFNPKSYWVQGFYRVRLPAGAIIESFATGNGGQPMTKTSIVSRFRSRSHTSSPSVLLEWNGGDWYQGIVSSIGPGKTKVVRLTYVQWLRHRPGRRLYVYPMGGGKAPNLAEFAIDADISKAGADKVQASLNARVSGGHVLLTKSDFQPKADFVLELLSKDGKKSRHKTVVYRAPAQRTPKTDSIYLVLDPSFSKADTQMNLVIVADLSAGLEPAQVKLVRDTVDALLTQLKESDRVALIASDVDALLLGGKPATATAKRKDQLLALLAKRKTGGASDIGLALDRAARLLPAGRGTIVYIGDGRPSMGAMLPGLIRDRLRETGRAPRLFAVAVGNGSDAEFLRAVAGPDGSVVEANNRQEAAVAVFHILSEAARASLRRIQVTFDGDVNQVYPSAPFTVTQGSQIRVSARCLGKLPKKVTVRGLRNGKPFSTTYKVAIQAVADHKDLTRRWALARIASLMARGAGREAVADLGIRFGVLTPWTALGIGAASGYKSLLPHPPAQALTVEALASAGNAVTSSPLAIERNWLDSRSSQASWPKLYSRLLSGRDQPVRLCYERKAAVHPELSGRVDLQIELRPNGSIKSVKQVYSSLNDSEVEDCIKQAVLSLKLPAPPPGAPASFIHTFHFTQKWSRYGRSTGCSKASRKYLSVRKVLWRERLARNSGVSGAISVWRRAYRSCELNTWLDRQTLLDLMLRHVGRTRQQVRLYHDFDGKPSIQAYMRRQILRHIRTRADVLAARAGLNLEGNIDWTLLRTGLTKYKKTTKKIRFVQSFIALSPSSIRLRRLLLALYVKAGDQASALDLTWQLRADPATDLDTRRLIGEILYRFGDKKEARRAFSEMVEAAPFDPMARLTLADEELAHGWCRDAYSQYELLAWLIPSNKTVPLMMARAAICTHRFDQALRLAAGVSQTAEVGTRTSGSAAAARIMMSVILARLTHHVQPSVLVPARSGSKPGSKPGSKTEAPSDKHAKQQTAAADTDTVAFPTASQLAARKRQLGLHTWAGKLLVTLTWRQPRPTLRLRVRGPGQAEPIQASIRYDHLNLDAERFTTLPDGDLYLEVRPVADSPQRSHPITATIALLWDESNKAERLVTKTITIAPGKKVIAFLIKKGKLQPTKPIKPARPR